MSIITLGLSADRKTLSAFGKDLAAECLVHNELNGLRPKDRIYYSTNYDGSKGSPTQPRIFPAGKWNVFTPIAKTDPYLAPWFIPTDAHQTLQVWGLDLSWCYTGPIEVYVEDYGYGIHHSAIDETFGCERIQLIPDIEWLALQVKDAITSGNEVQLIVL
jgi:hypothetical protein